MEDHGSSDAPHGEDPTRARLVLATILVLAVVLRLWFATAEPRADGFFFDERIPMRNIASILETGSLKPQNFWYQSLSHLPQAGLLAASEKIWQATGWEALRVRGQHGFRPAAFRICRGTTILFGILSLLLTFRIGRRLFSPRVGLLATFVLAFLPWHIFTSARFKPDSLLLLLTLLTFWWILDAEEKGGRVAYMRAGLGVGLAVATKLNGFVIAVPLVLLALVRWRRAPRGLACLSLAGVTAVLVYLLFNPWVAETLETLDQNREYYARAADREGGDRLEVLVRGITSFGEPQFHGWLLGIAAIGGLLLLLFTVLGGRNILASRFQGTRARAVALLLLSFPTAQVMINAAATERFKENHLVQLTPFTSLWVALALAELLRVCRRRARPGRPLGRLATEGVIAGVIMGVILLLGMAGLRGFDGVYRAVVPSNFERAVTALESRWPASQTRLLCLGPGAAEDELALVRDSGLIVRDVGGDSDLSAHGLGGCDAVLAEVTWLDSPAADTLRGPLFAAIDGPARRFETSWWQSRGEPWLLGIRSWQAVGEREPIAFEMAGTTLVARLPPCETSDQWRTLELRTPFDRLERAWPRSADVSTPLAWHWIGRRKPGHLFVSDRFPCSGTTPVIEITLGAEPPRDRPMGLWKRPWRRDQDSR